MGVKTDHRTWAIRPRSRDDDGPHAVVGAESWYERGYRKQATICRCGKRYTGWGDTSIHTHARHVRAETKKEADRGLVAGH